MKKYDKEHISIWASRPEVWDLEPQRVKLRYGAEVEKARKAMEQPEAVKDEEPPKAKKTKKKAGFNKE